MRAYLWMALIVLSLSAGASQAAVIFVNGSSTAAKPDGSSWAKAFPTLQQALAIAQSGQQIWVAQGSYLASTNSDATASLTMVNGVLVYGGFNGTETDISQRDIKANVTTLSGAIGGVALSSLHVVLIPSGVTGGTLDGFTISGGNANGASPDDQGGGILVQPSASFTMNNCIITGNMAQSDGAGLFTDSSSTMTVTNCTFSGNTSEFNGGGAGTAGTTSFTQCVFLNNSAANAGGGIDNYGNQALLNCVFEANRADIGGGARNLRGSENITNCVFFNNVAKSGGGGFRQHHVVPATLTNCTFTQNRCTGGASAGGAISFFDTTSQIKAVNLICFNDEAASKNEIEIDAQNITFSDIEGGYAGTGNIDADPQFIGSSNATGPDGLYFTADDGLHLSAGSPCIDSGGSASAATDVTGIVPRRIGAAVDMGAYEFAPAPVITVPVSVTAPFTASVQASDANIPALPIAFTWSKLSGPGTVTFTPNGTATSNITTMTFSAPGNYVIQVLVSNGAQFSVSTITILVVGPPFVINPPDDSDKDGFPDEVENALNTDPHSSASTPFGGLPATVKNPIGPINITSMKINLNFSSAGRDSISINGTVSVPAQFAPNQKVGLVVGGIVRHFALNGDGSATSAVSFTTNANGQVQLGTGAPSGGGKNSFKISVSGKPDKVTGGQVAKVSIKLSGGSDYKSNLASRGLVADANYKNKAVVVRVSILFYDTQFYDSQKVLSWTARKGKAGSARPGVIKSGQ